MVLIGGHHCSWAEDVGVGCVLVLSVGRSIFSSPSTISEVASSNIVVKVLTMHGAALTDNRVRCYTCVLRSHTHITTHSRPGTHLRTHLDMRIYVHTYNYLH